MYCAEHIVLQCTMQIGLGVIMKSDHHNGHAIIDAYILAMLLMQFILTDIWYDLMCWKKTEHMVTMNQKKGENKSA